MTNSAYILVNTEVGEEESVLKILKEKPHVKEAYLVYGVYDIIARVEAEGMQALKDVITANIRRIDAVRSTLTMIVMQ